MALNNSLKSAAFRHPVTVTNNLFTSETRKQLGPAIYTYLFLLAASKGDSHFELSADKKYVLTVAQVAEGAKITAADIAEYQGVSDWTILSDLKLLKELGLVRAHGPADGGLVYEVVSRHSTYSDWESFGDGDTFELVIPEQTTETVKK